MTPLEKDLLKALKDLLAASKAMTSGQRTTADDMQHYYEAIARSERVIEVAKSTKPIS